MESALATLPEISCSKTISRCGIDVQIRVPRTAATCDAVFPLS